VGGSFSLGQWGKRMKFANIARVFLLPFSLFASFPFSRS
jgi:hypothetical protein